MRLQLYREISNNFENLVVRISLSTSIAGLQQAAPLHLTDKLDLSFNVWNFYNDEKRRDLLYELNEASAISRIHDKFSYIVNEERPGYAIVRAREACAEVEERLLDGSLNKKLFRKVSSPKAWKFMDDLLSGKRDGHRKSLNPL